MKEVDTAQARLRPESRIDEDPRTAGLGLAAALLPVHTGERAVWHYENGLFLQAVRTAGLVWDRPDFVRSVDETVASFVIPGMRGPAGSDIDAAGDKIGGDSDSPRVRIRGYRTAEYNLDQINPGKNLFPLLALDTASGMPTAGCIRDAIVLLRSQLPGQPKTPSGGYWHKLIYPDQIWLDGLYMAEPFLARYAATFGEPDIFAGIAFQFSLVESAMKDPATGLLYHGWDESRRQAWADPATGCSPHFWGRAIGWFAMALVDCLEWIPAADPASAVLKAILGKTAESMMPYQDPDTGLWWQIVDRADQAGNYLEASVSAMMSYALGKAVRLGFLPGCPFAEASRQAFLGCVKRFLARDGTGGRHLEGTCAVAGLGGNPYRDGSYAYYIGEPVKTDDCKGAGPFILAATEQWLSEGTPAS